MGMDPVSFVFAQVLQQIEWLHEAGAKAYQLVTENLLQLEETASPDSEPASDTPPSADDGGEYTQSITDTPIASPNQTLDSRPKPRPPGSLAHPTRASKLASKFKKKTGPPEAPERSSSAAAPPPPPPARGGAPLKASPAAASARSQSTSSKAPAPAPAAGNGRRVPPAPGQQPAPQEEEDLGPVNSRIRRAFEGGFLISTAVDQALALTPGVPEAFRDRVVDRTEENVGPWVRAVTDPKKQAAIRGAVGKSYSALARRKDRQTSDANTYLSSLRSVKPSSGMIPGFTVAPLTSEQENTSDGEAPLCITTVHSFLASPEWEITSVVTATYVGDVFDGDGSPRGD